ncbi:hypothetical protein [Chryseobacterium sp.]|uniref:hypothetical protein n=1 Tax=Chryseobacterium sp. TaxID=1871047 RepID=UPI002898194A|nr:hypothetical protein [Chryseobacterium sp.]
MINLIKKTENQGRRKQMFEACKSLDLPKRTKNGVDFYILDLGDNVANIWETGFVNFLGFKNINEVAESLK